MSEEAAGAAPPKRAAAVVFVCAVMLIDTISFGILIPVLPAYLMEVTGQGASEATRIAGYLLVVFAVLQFLSGPILGALSDRYGRRPVLLLSMAAFVANYLLMGFADALWMLFLGRALSGVAGATYGPANAYVADITPPEQRAQRFALVGAAFGVGFVVGPALGGLIGQISPRAPLFLAAAMAGLNLLFGLFVLPESLPPERRRPIDWRRANPLGALAALRRHKGALPVVLCMFLFNFAFQVYPATWSFFATLKFGWQTGAIGAALAYSGLLMALMQGFFTGRIVRAVGERRAAMFGLGSSAVGMACNAFSTQGWQAYVCSTLGAAQGMAQSAMNAIASSRVPTNAQGELQGAVASLNGLAMIFSPFILTQTLSFFTSPAAPVRFSGAAFALAGVLTLVSIAAFMAVTRGFTRLEARA